MAAVNGTIHLEERLPGELLSESNINTDYLGDAERGHKSL